MALRHDHLDVTGPARLDLRTKDLIRRLQPGDIAFIDHEDLDLVAAEGLVDAGVAAVVNAARSVSGRYPNVGPLRLLAAGIPLLDAVGHGPMQSVHEGDTVALAGEEVWRDHRLMASGQRQTMVTLEHSIEAARATMGAELDRFAENTLEFMRRERHLLTDDLEVPDVGIDFRGRHALIVVRGHDHRSDLAALRRTGYLQEMKPVFIGVDGGADALREMGYRPDVIIGDFDSVSEAALRGGAALVVHAYPGGRAPGAERLERLGLPYCRFESGGTSEDIAMLLAYEHRAELIVAVGTHNSMVEFLDKGRAGMASTFLVRLRVNPILVDARGVSRLYQPRIKKRDLGLLVLSALFTLVVITLLNEPLRLVLRTFLHSLF